MSRPNVSKQSKLSSKRTGSGSVAQSRLDSFFGERSTSGNSLSKSVQSQQQPQSSSSPVVDFDRDDESDIQNKKKRRTPEKLSKEATPPKKAKPDVTEEIQDTEHIGSEEWLDAFFGDSNQSNPNDEVNNAVQDPRRRESLMLNISTGSHEPASKNSSFNFDSDDDLVSKRAQKKSSPKKQMSLVVLSDDDENVPAPTRSPQRAPSRLSVKEDPSSMSQRSNNGVSDDENDIWEAVSPTEPRRVSRPEDDSEEVDLYARLQINRTDSLDESLADFEAALVEAEVSVERQTGERVVRQPPRIVAAKGARHRAPILGADSSQEQVEPTPPTSRPPQPRKATPTKPAKPPGGFIDVSSDIKQLSALQKKLREAHEDVCFGVVYRNELTSYRVPTDEPLKKAKGDALGLSFRGIAIYFPAEGSAAAYYIHVDSDDAKDASTPSINDRWDVIIEFLQSTNIERKVCFDSKQVLKSIFQQQESVNVRNLADVQIMAWVWNPELPCGFQFVQLCRHFIEEDPPRLDLFKTRQSLLLRDMELCCKLSTKLIKDLRYDNLWEAYVNQESRISPILAKMELVGIEFDNEALLACEQKIHQRLSQLQIEAEKVCGFFVQLSSAKQVSQALFDRLKLQPETQRDSTLKSGGISTGESVLKSISNQHPLPRLVLEYRHLSKILSNWIDTLDRKQARGRVRTVWDQTGTATGRLSSSQPNLQNLPRGEFSFEIPSGSKVSQSAAKPKPTIQSTKVSINVRKSFVSGPGKVFVGADYSQLEMRLMAHIAKDSTLASFFLSGKDVHTLVASHWKKKPIQEVLPAEREQAKRMVYGITYGMGPVSLGDILGVTKREAKSFMDTFLSSYPSVQQFVQTTIQNARRDHFVRTMFGRRRVLDVESQDEERRADRQAVNAVIQGTAADIVKLAMLHVEERIRGTSANLLLQIHDELIYEVDEGEAEKILSIIKECMEQVTELDIPLPVSLKIGKSWGELKSFKFPDTNADGAPNNIGVAYASHRNSGAAFANAPFGDVHEDDDLFNDIMSSFDGNPE